MLFIRRMVIRWCEWQSRSDKLSDSDKIYYRFKLASLHGGADIPLKIKSGFKSFRELSDYIELFLSEMKNDQNEHKRNFEYDVQETYRDYYFQGYEYGDVSSELYALYKQCKNLLPKDSSLSNYPRKAGIMAVRLVSEFSILDSQLGKVHESKTNNRRER